MIQMAEKGKQCTKYNTFAMKLPCGHSLWSNQRSGEIQFFFSTICGHTRRARSRMYGDAARNLKDSPTPMFIFSFFLLGCPACTLHGKKRENHKIFIFLQPFCLLSGRTGKKNLPARLVPANFASKRCSFQAECIHTAAKRYWLFCFVCTCKSRDTQSSALNLNQFCAYTIINKNLLQVYRRHVMFLPHLQTLLGGNSLGHNSSLHEEVGGSDEEPSNHDHSHETLQ